jgi:hypothetical protein
MTKLFLTYRLKQELPYWTGYHSENPNIDPRLCFGLTWESLDDCQANMEINAMVVTFFDGIISY